MTFNKVVFDIETTLTADKIWCIVCKDGDTFYQFKENNLHICDPNFTMAIINRKNTML